jgi:hypothetical protein
MASKLESSGFLPVMKPKTLAYAALVDNEEALHHRIMDACQTICNYTGIFERMQNIIRVEACIGSQGKHFERLLYIYSQVKCFVAHAVVGIFLVLICGTHEHSLSAPFSYTLYIERKIYRF